MKPLVVGFESYNYGAARNCYAPVKGVEYVKLRRAPLEWMPGKESRGFHRIFMPAPPNPKVDLIHLWNRVSIGSKPWGVSFEDTLPYLNPRLHDRMIRFQRRRLLSDRCRFVIAVSQHALGRLQSTLSDAEWETVRHKAHHVLPHHEGRRRSSDFPTLSDADPLRLLFVGVTFFGKGGQAILECIERFGDELDLQLTVVSPVAGRDYAGTPPAEVDVADVQRRLEENPRISWTKSLPNEAVLAEIERHHLGLLPTLADTFGYVVLEYMALGLPSIVSNVQALPEFTGTDTGWQLEVDVDEQGVWLGRRWGIENRRRHYREATERIAGQLEETLRSVRNDTRVLSHLSASARTRYELQFDPLSRAEQVGAFYAEAIDR